MTGYAPSLTDTAVPILMYHSVSSSATPAFHRFAVHPRRFAAHMADLAARGVHTLTMRELHALRTAGTPPPPRSVVLTFDDGFADFHSEALPVLRRHGFVATLYVVTGCVGGTSRWLRVEREADRPMLSWTQLAEIAEAGVECAAHSHSHPQLDRLPAEVVRAELTTSRHLLEDRLQTQVESFAYPFGFHSRTVRELAREAGYRSACTVMELISYADDPYAVPRLTVASGMDVPALDALLVRPRPAAAHRRMVEMKRIIWQGLRRHAPDRLVAHLAERLQGSGR